MTTTPDIVERLRTEPDCKCAAHSRSECSCNTSWPEEHIDEAARAATDAAGAIN